jgi:hypothetical protein
LAASATLREIAFGLTFSSLSPPLRRRQLYSSAPRFRQTDGDRLLWRASAMFAFPDMFHFLAHEFARLGGRRFAFTFIFTRSFGCFFFWHNNKVSPLIGYLDVAKKALISACIL